MNTPKKKRYRVPFPLGVTLFSALMFAMMLAQYIVEPWLGRFGTFIASVVVIWVVMEVFLLLPLRLERPKR